MRRKLIVGNWKMNGSLAMNAELLSGIREGLAGIDCDLAICVPFRICRNARPHLKEPVSHWAHRMFLPMRLAAYTGQISTRMLLDFDCKYVIVGHSERREYCNESDELVANKVQRALAGGLTPIVCVGESLYDKEEGLTAEVVGRQINTVLSVLEEREVCDIVVAYEPVWAIGTGKTPSPMAVEEVHAMLREQMIRKNPDAIECVRILYGGSMKPANAEELLHMPDIDGGLIGGASLKASDFLAIARQASKLD